MEGRRTGSSLAAELGSYANTICKWTEQYKADPENAFPGTGYMKPEKAELAKAQS